MLAYDVKESFCSDRLQMDGVGCWHPTNSGGEYYWIHQDAHDDAKRLLDSRGKPRDYSSTMRWLIATQILMYYEDAFPEHVFIDRSATTPLTYQLQLDFPAPKQPRDARVLESQLDVDWQKFE